MNTKHTPGPVTGPYHGPSISDQLRLIRALCGTDDPTGKAELRAAVAYVSVVTAEMLEALEAALPWIEAKEGTSDANDLIVDAVRAAITKARGNAANLGDK